MASVEQVLTHIYKRQQEGGTGNPEGKTEMHSYHVWEVLNALKELREDFIEKIAQELFKGALEQQSNERTIANISAILADEVDGTNA